LEQNLFGTKEEWWREADLNFSDLGKGEKHGASTRQNPQHKEFQEGKKLVAGGRLEFF
jgi:hypothetical protein